MIKKLVSLLVILMMTHPARGQEEAPDLSPSPFPSAGKQSKEYRFEAPEGANAKKTKPLGLLKFIEKKAAVTVEFEGNGLKKGDYRIHKVHDCKATQKAYLAKKNPPLGDEMISFDTEYGELSTEKNLTAKSIEELAIENSSFVLIRVKKSETEFVACSQ